MQVSADMVAKTKKEKIRLPRGSKSVQGIHVLLTVTSMPEPQPH